MVEKFKGPEDIREYVLKWLAEARDRSPKMSELDLRGRRVEEVLKALHHEEETPVENASPDSDGAVMTREQKKSLE